MKALLLIWLLCASALHAQPLPVRAPHPAAACVLEWSTRHLYVRELTGQNDGPEIDAWNRAAGSPLRSFWCGTYQAAGQRACGLPVPDEAGAARNWTRAASSRTYYIRGERGTVEQLRAGHQVTFFYTNLGRVGHVARLMRPTRFVRAGRPARGWYTNEGNTGTGGGRNGGGVHQLTRASTDFYAAADWLTPSTPKK